MSGLFKRLKSVGKLSEEEKFENHIKQWFPVSFIIGIVVGFFMAIFYTTIILIANLLNYFPQLFSMLLGGLIIFGFVKINFEKVDENGITYVISKRHKEENIPVDVGTKKFVTSSIAIGSGLPVGREGPALIIGSSIATKIVQWANIPKEYQYQAITLGSAASTGALFQSPFGSAVFAAEVPYKEDSDEPMLMAAFLASVVAAVTTKSMISIFNNYLFNISLHIFLIGNALLEINVINSIFAIILGVITGIIGRLFISLYYFYSEKIIIKIRYDIAVLVGLGISLFTLIIGLLLIPDLFLIKGISSFIAIENFILEANNSLLKILVLAIIIQIISTTAIIGAGFPGGIFSPSLAVGAITGIIFAILLNVNEVEIITAWAIVGMSASHAATTKTPIASVILILEITGLPNLIIPIILANISSYIVSGHRSLYKGQLHSRNAAILRQLNDYDQNEVFIINQVMTPLSSVFFVEINTPAMKIKQIFNESSKRDLPVVDDMKVVGMVSIETIDRFKNKLSRKLAKDLMIKHYVALTPEINGKSALEKMLVEDVERAPVTDNDGKLIGIVSIKDIIHGHKMPQ